jgi:hypothetical protein
MAQPVRPPWLTSAFGSVLRVALPVIMVIGLLSYIAYSPHFGRSVGAALRASDSVQGPSLSADGIDTRPGIIELFYSQPGEGRFDPH